jgi:hypothetical protein
MFLAVVNQTVLKLLFSLNCLPNCSAFLEQDEPLWEEHHNVPVRGEPNCSQISHLFTQLFRISRTRRTCPGGTP